MSIVLRLKIIKETVPSLVSFSFVQVEYRMAGLSGPNKLSFFILQASKTQTECTKLKYESGCGCVVDVKTEIKWTKSDFRLKHALSS